jgi:hypothetical protein
LSFEFAIPEFAEDAVASHITTTGVPWKSPRYTDPARDISEPRHRQALSDRYEAIGAPSPVNQVVASVTNAVSADEAPEDGGLTTIASPLEMFALFQSEEKAVPTFRGIAVVQDVPAGDHSLTINGAGVAPHSETVPVSDENDVTAAGVEGEIPVVAQEEAVKMEVDPASADSKLANLAVEDDFAGRLYDAPLTGKDAVYLHQGGAFTTEVRDEAAEIGVFRVNPSEGKGVRLEDVRTGKAPMAEYLADIAAETRDDVAAAVDDEETGGDSATGGTDGGNAVEGLLNALDAVVEAARRAAENAEAGDRGNADQNLETVKTRLQRVSSRLQEARGSLPDDLTRAADRRLDQANQRAEQALQSDKL